MPRTTPSVPAFGLGGCGAEALLDPLTTFLVDAGPLNGTSLWLFNATFSYVPILQSVPVHFQAFLGDLLQPSPLALFTRPITFHPRA